MRQRKGAVYKESLAYLTDMPVETADPLCWQGKFYEGTHEIATRHGFKLEMEQISPDPKEQRAMGRVLIACGIRGLIISSITLWQAGRLHFDWKHFAAVELGNSLWPARLHRVESDTSHGTTLLEALRNLKKRGYRRTGFALESRSLRIRRWGPLATFLLSQHLAPGLPRLTPLSTPDSFTAADFQKWLAKERPDVIVTAGPLIFDWLQELQISVPEQMGVIRFDCTPENQATGLAPDYQGIGQAAFQMLHRMLDFGELGLPSHPRVLQQPAIWQEGKTLRG